VTQLKRRVIDVENTTCEKLGSSRMDMLPFSGTNELISVGITDVDTKESWYFFLFHDEFTGNVEDNHKQIQELILTSDILIGHNLKHDLIWLMSCGFKVPRLTFWDTAIFEYVLARGQVHQNSFALKDVLVRQNLTKKRTDLMQEYYDNKVTLDHVPIGIVEEYGIGDCESTAELYLNQLERLGERNNIGLKPTIEMMNEFLYVLTKWSLTGIKLDRDELLRVREEFVVEKDNLVRTLTKTAQQFMGDTPFNLNSGEDMSVLLYSRRVSDKREWKNLFNVGSDARGRKLRRPRMNNHKFTEIVRRLAPVESRTTASQCKVCRGVGRNKFAKKDGTMSKAVRICKECEGKGYLYTKQKRVAGFKFVPGGVKEVSANGFVTDAATLKHLSAKVSDPRVAGFLTDLQRLHAVNVYISTFCDGLLNNMQSNHILHTTYNQIVTSTARLSSSNPNLQNQPRGSTFPVRRAIVSRFPGGTVMDGDYGQLEFRVAADISGCERAMQDILDSVDVHLFTRDTLNAAGMKVDRQDSKAHTFKPLYGGEMGTKAETTYYRAFKAKYAGITGWQDETCETVLNTLVYALPSGREYTWPTVHRSWNGRVQPKTQIVNWPVQGFATGDIVPLGCIMYDKAIERHGLKSVPFLTVHDSIATDVYPGESGAVAKIKAETMLAVREDMKKRYNYQFKVPLEVEIKEGINWLDMKKVLTKGHEHGITSTQEPKFYIPDDNLDDIGVL
jgi:DNA polymerase I-like protein with 3'-5' exonuclease and polymerase domains|tara:strand:- start:944 stop:3133 length:2190 start_codon:yes stop_codon:yes gene_type:complete